MDKVSFNCKRSGIQCSGIRFYLIALVLLLLFVQSSNFALAVPVQPDQGISFAQVDFNWPEATILNSNTSQINVDVATLKTYTGMSSGYVNVYTNLGWVVQNLPVFPDFSYPNISTKIPLDVENGADVTYIDAYIEFSSEPYISFIAGSPNTFLVGNTGYNAQGKGLPISGNPVSPQPDANFNFDLFGLLQVCLQPNHPNVEAAMSQCGPAAAANSLQWLENIYREIYGHNIIHPNVPGLGNDGSLVGQLDLSMSRPFVNRTKGNGINDTNFLRGKLTYLKNNGLGGDVLVKHQDDGPSPGGGNFSAAGLTSIGKGNIPNASFIISEVCAGEDVELGYTYNGGGHWVELVGAGYILGVPFVFYKSDHNQSDQDIMDGIDNNEGTETTDFSFLVDTADADSLLNLINESGKPNVDIVVAESPRRTDNIPPKVYALYSTDDYGIIKLNVSDLSHTEITVQGFTPTNVTKEYDIIPPLKRVNYTRLKIPAGYTGTSSYRITATDIGNNVVSACPLFLKLSREAGEPVNFKGSLFSTEYKFSINNSGVMNIQIDLNTEKLKLIAHQYKRGKEGNTYFIPEYGEYDINLSSYMVPGDNSIFLEARGKPEASADIVISE